MPTVSFADMPKCGKPTNAGTACAGVQYKDTGSCWAHLDKQTRQTIRKERKAAQREEDKAKREEEIRKAAVGMIGRLKPVNVQDPYEEMRSLAGTTLALTRKVEARVAALTEIRHLSKEGTEQVRGEIQLYTQLLRDATAVLAQLTKLGLDERAVTLKERQLTTVHKAIEAGLRAAGLEGAPLMVARQEVVRYLRTQREPQPIRAQIERL